MKTEIKSLYRVHRPRQFDEVIGQNHITQTLINQINRGNVGHAYLFCGTRGTGKTSVAKIFANAVNCLDFKDGKICGKCDYCKRAGTTNMDVFELDAASNNRVEDVRDLIEKVKYPPVFSKYKVYIVDEVHMFSTAAFNAFLKTLEEPPSHVIFILATTESHKLLPTVQSRCLRFDFRSVSVAQLQAHIAKVFKAENIEADEKAVLQLAKMGQGSVRDALSFADMVSAYASTGGGKVKITEAMVTDVAGAVTTETLQTLVAAILKGDAKEVCNMTTQIFECGRNVTILIKDMLDVIKDQYIEVFQADKQKASVLMQAFKIFSELEQSIKNARNEAAMFQGACLLALDTATSPSRS